MATRTTKAPAGPKPDIYVVEDNFHAKLGQVSGEDAELVLPLKVPYKTFKKLTALTQDDALEDIERFVEEIGTAEARKTLEEADDAIQVIVVATTYFQMFTDLADARLGELKASSGD
ncbi:hypothetical protein [Microbacterium sp. MMO-56]|uniref:hypothetical protein n=1 Tax=Microbacterium sp. MMO-56 TaxID=3081281 RepID=UPI0030164ACA